MNQYEDDNPDYWEDYNNLQRVKHEMLRYYLGGWYFILSSWSARILYIDCHAGRGKHETGQMGSPLIALETLLNHKARQKILKNCEIHFYFIEADATNKLTLEQNLAAYEKQPKIFIRVECGDFSRLLQDMIAELRRRGAELAPAFVFVDPYGFRLPGDLLAQLKSFPKCELFITFMWRWIDMALKNPSHEANMDALFVAPDWRDLPKILNPDERCEAAIQLLNRQIGGKYLTRFKMLGDHGEIKYVLIHTTGHPKGRELMLQAMWKIAPTGTFKVRVNDNPNQEKLFQLTSGLEPLKDWLYERYGGRVVRVGEIESGLEDPGSGTFYLKPHLHEAIKQLNQAGAIKGPDRLVFKENPTLHFHTKKPDKPEGSK